MLFHSFSGISTCLGNMDLDSLGVIFIYILIGRLIGRQWDQSVELEFARDLDRKIRRPTGISIR